jgi:hypothetical protein
MSIVGFNFNKISIEKLSPVKGKINISNNVSIVSVEKTQLAIGAGKEDGLRFGFEFTSQYNPKVGVIDLRGEVIFMTNEKSMEAIMDEWKKDKKIPKDVMTNLLNNVLNKCNIQALILSKDMNLPPPIPLPKVKESTQ